MQQLSQKLVVVGILLGMLVFVLALIGCGSEANGSASDVGNLRLSETQPMTITEVNRDGEESGTQLALGDTLNEVQSEVRLVLSYDPTANAFTGTVQNTTGNTLPEVSIRVRLSNGIDWVLTNLLDLAPSQVREVTIPVGSEPFTSWSAHLEIN